MKGEKYLFVVSGPSGTGKDTVVASLLKKTPGDPAHRLRHHPHPRVRARRTASTTIS